jgi:hypothetical protein
MSVEWLCLKSGASSSSILLHKWGNQGRVIFERKKGLRDVPAFLLVQLVAHALGKFLEFTFGFGIVGVDHEVLKVP